MIAESVDLALPQATRLAELETLINSRSVGQYMDVGAALREIRDEKMWPAQYTDYYHYCRARLGFSWRQSGNYIRSSIVAENVSPALPSITQALFLSALPISQQRDLVAKIEANGGLANTPSRAMKQMVSVALRGGDPFQGIDTIIPRDQRIPTLGQKELWACQVRRDFDRQIIRLVRMFEKSNPLIATIYVMRDQDGKCTEIELLQLAGDPS